MSNKFCPKCGKETEDFHDNLCSECYLKPKTTSDKFPSSFSVKRCGICKRYLSLSEGKQHKSMDEAIEDDISKILNKPNISSANFHVDAKRNKVVLTVKTMFGSLEKEETEEINLSRKTIRCKFCQMKISGYYQSVLQLRLPKEIMESAVDEIVKQLSFANQLDPQSFISKMQRINDGVDLYIGSKKAANDIVKSLKNEMRIKTKFSKKLGGKLRGKDVYRDTILITI
ncbi:MAG TPA: NMD3-related protein [archaeon]|nr:NMD3-related protein [archaeon]